MKTATSIFTVLIAASVLHAVGCKDAGTITSTAPDVSANTEDSHVHVDGTEHASHHAHGAGPHDGTVADWGGGKFHVEFTVDHDKQECTVYILGADETTPVAIDAQSIDLSIIDPVMQVTLIAAPQVGEPEGKASRFIGNHENLAVVQEYAGTIAGVIDGTPYSGDFEDEPHGDHDH